jgi:hypothetical protein
MLSMTSPLTQQRSNIIQQLERELSKLKNRFQMAQELRLEWVPDGNSKKSGEVLGRTIHIYEEDETKALDTLRHEFIDYIISIEFEAPYKRLINKLISCFEEEMYEKKEHMINKLLEALE